MMQSSEYRAFQYQRHRNELEKIKNRKSQWMIDTSEKSQEHYARKQRFKSMADSHRNAHVLRENLVLYHRLKQLKNGTSDVNAMLNKDRQRNETIRQFRQRSKTLACDWQKKKIIKENKKMKTILKNMIASPGLTQKDMKQHWISHLNYEQRLLSAAKNQRRNPNDIVKKQEKNTEMVLSQMRKMVMVNHQITSDDDGCHNNNNNNNNTSSQSSSSQSSSSDHHIKDLMKINHELNHLTLKSRSKITKRSKSFLLDCANQLSDTESQASKKAHQRSSSMKFAKQSNNSNEEWMNKVNQKSMKARPAMIRSKSKLTAVEIRKQPIYELKKHAKNMSRRKSAATLGLSPYLLPAFSKKFNNTNMMINPKPLKIPGENHTRQTFQYTIKR